MSRDLPWPQARAVAATCAAPLPAVRLSLPDCAGTVLAGPLRARSALPAFDTAAMDGYAVCGPGPWRVVGELLAGGPPVPALTAGTAVRIATGAAVPAGTDAVLQVEHAHLQAGVVAGSVPPGRHIRRTGEECAEGDLLLPAGCTVTAAVLGLAAAAGHDALDVRPRPRVAALVTGDELLTQGLPRDGRIRDALGPQLPVWVPALGGELVSAGHLPDERALLRKAVEVLEVDVVVTSGASSAGPADHLRPVLRDLGAQLLVDGVACRPGHPQLLAVLADGRLVIGLPGNPLAAVVGALTVLGPALAALGGRRQPRHAALLAEPLPAPATTRLVPVRRDGLHARPVPHAGAAMLRGAATADALAVVPVGTPLEAGAEVELLPLP